MMGSLYSGVSGMKVHQVKMDVIGNNIANVNTVGFKKSSVNFAESMYRTTEGARAPQSGMGGTNPVVLMDDRAFVVSARNNTVVTVMEGKDMKENVFTNIDSMIIM